MTRRWADPIAIRPAIGWLPITSWIRRTRSIRTIFIRSENRSCVFFIRRSCALLGCLLSLFELTVLQQLIRLRNQFSSDSNLAHQVPIRLRALW